MLDFIKADTFTLADVFNSVLQEGKALLKETPKGHEGRVPRYLETARKLRDHLSGDSVSRKQIGLLLDEFDDGLSVKYPNDYPYALPLITSKADKKFCKIMLSHFEQTYEHSNKLDLSAYSFFIRTAINIGLIWSLPKQAKCLRERMDDFSSQTTFLRQFGLKHENKTLSDELPLNQSQGEKRKRRKALMVN